MAQYLKVHPSADSVGSELGRTYVVMVAHLYQSRTIRKPLSCINLKQEYGLLTLPRKTLEARVLSIRIVMDGKSRGMRISHPRLCHRFVKNGTRKEIRFRISQTRRKNMLASPISESLPAIPLPYRRMRRWRALGKKGKY